MSYIATLLHPDEEIILEARISPYPVWRPFYLLILYGLVMGGLGIFLMFSTGLTTAHFTTYYSFSGGYTQLTAYMIGSYPHLAIPAQMFQILTLGPVVLGLVCLAIGYAIYGFIIRIKTELVVTNLRVMAKVGWIAREIAELHHETVQDLFMDQSLLGRVFDYATISVRGYAGSVAKVPFVSEPVYFRSESLDVIEQLVHAQTQAQQEAAQHPPHP